MTKTKRRIHCQTIITPDERLAMIFGKDEIPYPKALKVLWAYMKANKLYRVEKI